MRKVECPLVIYPDSESCYVAEIPALKGCLAQSETLNETLAELEIVKNLWLETARETNLELPKVEIEIERVKQKLAA